MTTRSENENRTARARPRPGPKRSHGAVSRRTGSSPRRRAGAGRTTERTVRAKRADRAVAQPRPILRKLTRTVLRALIGIVILAVFIFGVFPTGSFLEQREQLQDAEQELLELQAENSSLEARVDRLESDSEIERVARNDFDMVLPNEESYLVLPPGE